MQRHHRISLRHSMAARVRWARAEQRAQAERDAGIPDRPMQGDRRQPITLDLRSYGGQLLRIEPRIGYVACRLVDDETGEVLRCQAIKELLHRIADDLPRVLGWRNFA